MQRVIGITLLIIVAIIIAVEAVVFLHIARLPFVQVNLFGYSQSLTHWISWAGTLYIAITTPILTIVKYRAPKRYAATRNAHMIGNLVAVLLVSIHFAHQVTRPAAFYPELGTGIVLYTTMVLLVATGIIMSTGLAARAHKQIRFFHPAFAITFYMVIILHIIQGL